MSNGQNLDKADVIAFGNAFAYGFYWFR